MLFLLFSRFCVRPTVVCVRPPSWPYSVLLLFPAKAADADLVALGQFGLLLLR